MQCLKIGLALFAEDREKSERKNRGRKKTDGKNTGILVHQLCKEVAQLNLHARLSKAKIDPQFNNQTSTCTCQGVGWDGCYVWKKEPRNPGGRKTWVVGFLLEQTMSKSQILINL